MFNGLLDNKTLRSGLEADVDRMSQKVAGDVRQHSDFKLYEDHDGGWQGWISFLSLLKTKLFSRHKQLQY